MSISLIASCSNGNFKSSEKETKPDQTSRAGQESTQAGKAVSPGSEFAQAGKSLNSEIEAKFRPGICDYPGRQSTKYAQGMKIALNDYAKNKGAGKFDLETTLFFSDGAAKDSPQELTDAINKLNSAFPKRVYGILLGKTSDVCTLEDNSGKNLSTEECLLEVVGKDPNKVIQATDAAGLSAAMTSLLQK